MTYLAVALVLVMVAALVTGVMLVRRPFPQVDGEVRLAGLDAEVTVLRDGRGIPESPGCRGRPVPKKVRNA